MKIHSATKVPQSSETAFTYLAVPDGLNIHDVGDTHKHISLVYFATTPHTNIVPEHPDDTWEWLTATELTSRDDIRDNIKHYALEALNTLGT